jgi:hypothetical protein
MEKTRPNHDNMLVVHRCTISCMAARGHIALWQKIKSRVGKIEVCHSVCLDQHETTRVEVCRKEMKDETVKILYNVDPKRGNRECVRV